MDPQQRNAEYYSRNREKVKDRVRRYKQAHPEWKRQLDAGYHARNRGRHNNRDRLRYLSHKREAWEGNLQRKFGISAAEYGRLLAAQGGVCAICTGPVGRRTASRLMVDHNHKTNKVRGLLCQRCNMGIGQFRDDPNLMARAVEYLTLAEATIILGRAQAPQE